MIYVVEISESLIKTISVEAESELEAVESIIRKYKDEDIVLNSDDFVGASFSVKSTSTVRV